MNDDQKQERLQALAALWQQRDEQWEAQHYAECAATSDRLIAGLEALRAEGEWTPDQQNDLARAYRERGVAAYHLAESVETQLAYYHEAIRLGEALDLSVAQYRHDLAKAHTNKGLTLHKLGTPQALAEAITAYDHAIRLRKDLDLSVAEYCQSLASTYHNKGLTLQALGTPQDLADAITAYDEAIRLGEILDLSVAEYRNALASSYHNKGNVLKDQQALVAAAVAYDEAIRLRKDLDLSVAEYRYNSATTYLSKGNLLKDQQALITAIAVYDEAIRLGEILDLSVAKYCFALSCVHHSKGMALQDQNSLQALADAIATYNEAIRLRETLDLSVAEYRNNLAHSYFNKGNALRTLGTPQGMAAAIAAYDEAIRLRETLDLSVAEYRNNLANAYISKGAALYALGTHQDLAAAIAAYDEAIRLGEALDLSVEKYRDDLASAYNNKGIALQVLGYPQDLTAAIAAHDEAIRLRETLDLSVEKYRNNLASAYNNRGNTKKQASDHGPHAALEDYDAALNVLWSFLRRPMGQRPLPLVEVAAHAFLGKALALLACHDARAAADAADEGLILLKELEINGVFWLRFLRERLFKITLDAYVQARMFKYLPEIVEEHLDPTQPGSAPASEALHAAAVRFLRQAVATLYLEPDHRQSVIDALKHTLYQLEQWRLQYFGGTAASARLQVAEWERTGDLPRAQQVLDDYIAQRPRDPEGYLTLAAFQVRHRQPDAAMAAYQKAAIALFNQAPLRGEVQPYAEGAARIVLDILQLKLLQQPVPETLDESTTVQQLFDILDAQNWVDSDYYDALLSVGPLPGALQHLIGQQARKGNALRAALKPIGGHLKVRIQEWVARFATCTREEAQKQAWEQLQEQSQAMARTLCVGLGIPWDTFGEGLTAAWLERWTFFRDEWQQADPAERQRLEEQIAEGLSHTVGELTRQLHQEVLAASEAFLHTELGPLWAVLQGSDDARFLACGHHLLRQLHQPESARFAGLELGLAVETGLLHRVFTPLKAHLRESGQSTRITLDPEDWSYRAGLFLIGQASHVELGPMAGAFGRTLKYAREELIEKYPSEYYGALADYLAALPNPAPLRDATWRKRRAAALGHIREWRNQCTHPKTPPTPPELHTMWAYVAGDPEQGFFRYLGAALVPPLPSEAPA